MCSKMIKPLSRSSHQIKSNNKFIATDSNKIDTPFVAFTIFGSNLDHFCNPNFHNV